MSRIPFHRRVFLWVFFITFIALAPTVVFYTAGYRWNPKKGAIERNGTLIIDTAPKGATIVLNGKTLPDRTPVTLQNVAPGAYTIRLERDDYHPWEKTLEVKAERVTFANNIRLWPVSEPALELAAQAFAPALSPNERVLAFLDVSSTGTPSLASGGGTRLAFYELATGLARYVTFETAPDVAHARLEWNNAGSAVLVKDGNRAWVASRSGDADKAISLPPNNYRWFDGRLEGVSDGERIEYVVASGLLRSTKVSKDILDEDDTFRLIATTGTGRLSVVEQSRPDRRFELPEGGWLFADRLNGLLFLKSTDAWLGFDPEEAKPAAVRLPADAAPAVDRRSGKISFLSRSGGEMWLLELGEQPELMLRKSQPLRGLAWQRDGADAVFATEHELAILNLDPRESRLETVLSSFDDIRGLVATQEYVYLAASRGGKMGIWKVRIE